MQKNLIFWPKNPLLRDSKKPFIEILDFLPPARGCHAIRRINCACPKWIFWGFEAPKHRFYGALTGISTFYLVFFDNDWNVCSSVGIDASPISLLCTIFRVRIMRHGRSSGCGDPHAFKLHFSKLLPWTGTKTVLAKMNSRFLRAPTIFLKFLKISCEESDSPCEILRNLENIVEARRNREIIFC